MLWIYVRQALEGTMGDENKEKAMRLVEELFSQTKIVNCSDWQISAIVELRKEYDKSMGGEWEAS